jgi:hypothetical protein
LALVGVVEQTGRCGALVSERECMVPFGSIKHFFILGRIGLNCIKSKNLKVVNGYGIFQDFALHEGNGKMSVLSDFDSLLSHSN